VTSSPSELDLYLALVGLLRERSIHHADLQVDCATRPRGNDQEYLIYATRAARPFLAEGLGKKLRRVFDPAGNEWVLSAEEARAVAYYRLW
jgi:hypothetical protein